MKFELGSERQAGFEKLKKENIIPGITPEIEGSMNIYMQGKYGMFGGTTSRLVWLEEAKLRHTRQG